MRGGQTFQDEGKIAMKLILRYRPFLSTMSKVTLEAGAKKHKHPRQPCHSPLLQSFEFHGSENSTAAGCFLPDTDGFLPRKS